MSVCYAFFSMLSIVPIVIRVSIHSVNWIFALDFKVYSNLIFFGAKYKISSNIPILVIEFFNSPKAYFEFKQQYSDQVLKDFGFY
jgi:hypothetical protein